MFPFHSEQVDGPENRRTITGPFTPRPLTGGRPLTTLVWCRP